MRTIILLHGALGSARQMELLEGYFTDFNVITPDFPGHGKLANLGDSFSIHEFAMDLKTRMEYLSEPADVFGYSMGGYVALYLASREPEKFNSITTLGTKFRWNPETAEKEVKMLNPHKIEEKVPALAQQLAERHGNDHWKDVVNRTALMLKNMGDFPPLKDEDLFKVNLPVQLLLGDEDNMVTTEETEKVHKILKQGVLSVLKKMPHPFEKVGHEKIAGIIRQFAK